LLKAARIDNVIHPEVAQHIPDIRRLCHEFRVDRLEIFGSAVTDDFDPERSDVDFVVTYPDGYDFGPWLGRVQDFERALADLLARNVDLVVNKPHRNRFFVRELNRTRQDIYDASEHSEVA
jgi:predicted nucleotidyltransferase